MSARCRCSALISALGKYEVRDRTDFCGLGWTSEGPRHPGIAGAMALDLTAYAWDRRDAEPV